MIISSHLVYFANGYMYEQPEAYVQQFCDLVCIACVKGVQGHGAELMEIGKILVQSNDQKVGSGCLGVLADKWNRDIQIVENLGFSTEALSKSFGSRIWNPTMEP